MEPELYCTVKCMSSPLGSSSWPRCPWNFMSRDSADTPRKLGDQLKGCSVALTGRLASIARKLAEIVESHRRARAQQPADGMDFLVLGQDLPAGAGGHIAGGTTAGDGEEKPSKGRTRVLTEQAFLTGLRSERLP